MALSTRVWGAGKLLVLGGALLATYLVFAAVGMRLALRAREVVVPELRGRTINEAQSALVDLDLGLQVAEGQRVDPQIAAGRIAVQEPPAGVATRRQRSVRVWVSAGQRASIVPALVGEGERSAALRLEQDGLALAEAAEIRSSQYSSDTVVAQTPAPGTRGTEVAVLVNRGESSATYVMPDLIGVNGQRAAEFLRTRGFRVAVVGQHPYPGLPAGVVLRQHPQPGFQIAPGEPISLEVSR